MLPRDPPFRSCMRVNTPVFLFRLRYEGHSTPQREPGDHLSGAMPGAGPVRLDHEILMAALAQAGETSAHDAADCNLSNRDLDDVSLLAAETPGLDNLNLAFNRLRRVHPIPKLTFLTKLNLSHNELLDVERLGALRDLQVLNLSKNKLSSVGSIAELQELEELWLRDNQFSELHALQSLGQCGSLKRLILKPNPVCKKCADLYWPFLVHNIASLEMLDGRPVGAEERDAAAAFLLSPEGRKQLREAGLNSRCNARARAPTVHQPADEGAIGWAHEGGNRRLSPPRKENKEAHRTQRPEQGQDPANARSGRPARAPLSSRAQPAGKGGEGRGLRVTESDGHKQLYSNGQIAVIARRNGASEARYFNGSIAVSLDSGRLTAMYRNGDVAVTSDEQGNAMVCLPSGLVIYNHAQGSGGRLQDLVTGQTMQEWDASGRPTGASAKNPAASEQGDGGVRGGMGNKALLQCRLNEHIGVRVESAGGKVEVFFVCDGSGAKGGGGGLPGSTKKEPTRRIKHRFSAARPGGTYDWDDSGPFGDGAAPPRERGPVVKLITTEEYVDEIRAATDHIIDFESLKANLGSGGDDISLAFRGKINASGTTAMALNATGASNTKGGKPGAAARRAAYDKSMRGKSDSNQIPRAASDTIADTLNAPHMYGDAPRASGSPGVYSQLQSYGTPTGSPSKGPGSPSKASPYRGGKGKSPKSPGVLLADDPTEMVQQLARNAQEALKRLAHNLEDESAAQPANNPSPKQPRRPARPPAASSRSSSNPSHHASPHTHTRRMPLVAAGPDKYLSPGGGFNSAANASGTGSGAPRERRQAAPAGRKKGRGGGEKLSTGEDVTPDLPAEEMQRLEAIRAQMRNMTKALGNGFG